MRKLALPLLLLAGSLSPGCFCIPRGCIIRDGDMMDCGPCPDEEPVITIPLPWAQPANPQPQPQTPLTRTPGAGERPEDPGSIVNGDQRLPAPRGPAAPTTR